jgi:hypothetical protein
MYWLCQSIDGELLVPTEILAGTSDYTISGTT